MKKTRKFRAWRCLVLPITILAIVANAVVTYHPFVNNTFTLMFGGAQRELISGDPSIYQRFKSDYSTKEEALAAAYSLNDEITGEGITLLKNDQSLPLAKTAKVTVFGKNSVNLVYGGSGSNAGKTDISDIVTLYNALDTAGIKYNPTLKAFYEDDNRSGDKRPAFTTMGVNLTGFPTAETEISKYSSDITSSYSEYSDAAIVVISRIGGEGYDMPRTMFWDGSSYTNWVNADKMDKTQLIPGARSKDDHYLQLDENEAALLKHAGDNFDNVIVVLNCSTPIELGFLDDPNHYAYHSNIKGAIWMGFPGTHGATALGHVLNGTVNPSGRLVDTYARDFSKDPTWNNFGNNRIRNGNTYIVDGKPKAAYYVDYDEGIYVGYRYYETRGFTEGESAYTDDTVKDTTTKEWDSWYNANVVYPFGYGLSYTTFKWELVSSNLDAGATLSKDGTIEIEVKVTNTGSVAGKDVVQLYYTAPYSAGEIEKAHVVLAGFEKTDLIQPGKSDTVKVTMSVRDMASYDYNDANGNSFKGYELDGGEYIIRLMRNAHEEVLSQAYNISSDGYQYSTDDATGKEINNLFDDVSMHIETYLSRNDWVGTWPEIITEESRATTNEFLNSLNYAVNDKGTDPWYTTEMPMQSDRVLSYKDAEIQLYEMIKEDVSLDDPAWDRLLDQLTIGQMQELISQACYKTNYNDTIGLPHIIHADGPMGFALFMGSTDVYDTCYYASTVVLASTWNKDLAHRYGLMIGNEGALGNLRQDGAPYSGWYAPAVNIHRSPFSGRNFEYFSEDGYITGEMAALIVKGARERGTITFVKHFALNDQETERDTTGLITWANEQSMREIYFKPFEMTVKDGKTLGIMSSFNRIGNVWAGGDYRLLTELLRDEWGFEGAVITDFNLTQYMDVDQMIRAGGDLSLSQSETFKDSTSATAVSSLRRAVKNYLYAVVNSSAMNGYGEGVAYAYRLPAWQVTANGITLGIIAFALVSGILTLLRKKR